MQPSERALDHMRNPTQSEHADNRSSEEPLLTQQQDDKIFARDCQQREDWHGEERERRQCLLPIAFQLRHIVAKFAQAGDGDAVQ